MKAMRSVRARFGQVVLLSLVATGTGCGGAQSGDDVLLPPPPDEGAPPDDSVRTATDTQPTGAALQGPFWDLAVLAREVSEHERHDWESQVRGLTDDARQSVVEALAAMADEEPTPEGLRQASGKAAAQRFTGEASGAGGIFQRGAVFVLCGMVQRVGEDVQGAREPIATGAELLRTIRALRFPAPDDTEGRGRLEREARTAMGPSLAAQAEAASRRR